MAQAIITCGQCGQRLTIKDTVCPQCNSPVDFSVVEPSGPIVCKACGQTNDPKAQFCQACGVRLGAPPPPKHKQPKPPKSSKPQASEKRKDYWPYVAVVATLALVAVVVYTEWFSSTPASSSSAAKDFPSAQAPKVSAKDIETARQAADANPDDMSLRLRLANMQQDAGFYLPAIENYKKYLTKEGTDANAKVDMGVCYYNLGLTDSVHAFDDYSAAVKEIRQAFSAVPSHQPAAFNLGIVFLQMGEMDSSNAWFKRAAAINGQTDLGKRAQKILEEHGKIQ